MKLPASVKTLLVVTAVLCITLTLTVFSHRGIALLELIELEQATPEAQLVTILAGLLGFALLVLGIAGFLYLRNRQDEIGNE
jgi:uncharacterized membrane protein